MLAFLEREVEPIPNYFGDGHQNLVRENGLKALESRSFCDRDNQLVSQARRPDIVKTLLSCRNAETELPYIDLTLEILENAVGPRSSEDALQTSLTPQQLAAQPEHFNLGAYDILAQAIFPFSLPFDLWHEEETIYLEKFGTSKVDLLETFYPFSLSDSLNDDSHDLTEIQPWQDLQIAKARLGLTDTEWSIIVNSDSTDSVISKAWGFSNSSDCWKPLTNVNTLLNHSELNYQDFLRLLRLKSFNPTGTIGIRDRDLGDCEPKAMHLQGLNIAALDFLHRFLRLQRALGWTLPEMDRALISLSPPLAIGRRPNLNEGFLVRPSHLIYLQEQFKLPLVELLSWWSNLDTQDYRVPQLPHENPAPSLYDSLFLTGRPEEPEFEAFKLNNTRTELQSPNQHLDEHQSTVAGALRVTELDLERLIADLINTLDRDGENSSPKLNLANLSTLYRHRSLARALGLNIEDYLTLKALINLDPFPPAPLTDSQPLPNILQTIGFVERAEALQDSDFAIAEVDYLLHQTMPFTGKTIAPTAEWIEESLSTLEKSVLSLSVSLPQIQPLHEVLDLLCSSSKIEEVSVSASEGQIENVRSLIEEVLDIFASSDNNQSEEFQTIQQLLQDAKELVSPDASFDNNAQVELETKINETLEQYKQYEKSLYRSLIEEMLNAFAPIVSNQSEKFQTIYQLLQDAVELVGSDVSFDNEDREQFVAKIEAALEQYENVLYQLRREILQTALAEVFDLPTATCKILLEETSSPSNTNQKAVDAFLNNFLPQSEPTSANTTDSGDDSNENTNTEAEENTNSITETDGELSDQAIDPPLPALLYRLHKAALVINRLGIRHQELRDVDDKLRYISMIQDSGWLDLTNLPVRESDAIAPFDSWMRTVRLFQFRDALPVDWQEYLFDLFVQDNKESFTNKLHELTDWDKGDLKTLIGNSLAVNDGLLQTNFSKHFADEQLLRRILKIVTLLKQLGVTAREAGAWIGDNLTARDRVVSIKNALKARYEDDWSAVLKPLRDPLREQQRQALVTYLMHEWQLERADDLFDHFLIDVEMSPCMMTSRLIQAIASIQLFVQRVQMNLEPGLALTDEGAEQWEWMKNYRVWEANRKIFLYPENWIEPELRDDKIPFFKDLEDELLQADITNE